MGLAGHRKPPLHTAKLMERGSGCGSQTRLTWAQNPEIAPLATRPEEEAGVFDG
jgi:hypothetical protein